MRNVIRWAVVTVVVLHGLIHLLGTAEGLGLAEIDQLREPISTPMGLAWLAAGALVVVAGVMMALDARRWWVVAAVAAVASQAVILTSFGDAAVGTVPNVLLLVAAGYGYVSRGPTSSRAEYRREVEAALADPPRVGTLHEADLVGLPEQVAAYLRRAGAVGRPRIADFRARIHGRIRRAPDSPWMTFRAEQVNTYGAQPRRLFLMDATMFGLPVDVLHRFVGPDASMRGEVLSLFTVLDEDGPEMARAETVTLFNDLCLFAPAGLVEAPVVWEEIDDRRVRGTYTRGAHAVSAELVFNERDELVDFVSEDRLAVGPDADLAPRRWSTPILSYAAHGGRWVAAHGEGRWHPDGDDPFTYIELHLDDVTYNLGPGAAHMRRSESAISPSLAVLGD